MLEKLLLTLTPRQIEAVEHSSGPLLILAGAGTGKTTTITGKIAFMIKKYGVEPEKILALTFSREAARNMETKIRELLDQGTDVKVSTFHAFCANLIKDNSERCGVSEQFTIFEDNDAAVLIYKELGITAKKASLYSKTISMAKDLNLPINEFKNYIKKEKRSLLELVEESRFEQFYTECQTNCNTFHLKDKNQQKATQFQNPVMKISITPLHKIYNYILI